MSRLMLSELMTRIDEIYGKYGDMMVAVRIADGLNPVDAIGVASGKSVDKISQEERVEHVFCLVAAPLVG